MIKIIHKAAYIFFIFLAVFGLTGCGISKEEKKNPDAPAMLKEVTGKIFKAKVDNNGDIIIKKNDVTKKVSYYSYEVDGIIISLLAVRDSNNNIVVVINTCQSCGGAPYAYFVQVDSQTIQCQNCGNLFKIDELTNLKENGCNPIGIEDIQDNDDTLIISHTEIEQYKDLFENWKGPKA